MALARPLPPLWQSLLPALHRPLRPALNLGLLQRWTQPFRLPLAPFAALPFPSLQLPSLPSLSEIWEGILKAVPKKKTSHRKKRQRFMAGKGLKDVTNLNKCSACGRVKRAHLLCPYCVYNIKTKIFGAITWDQRNPDGMTRKMRKQHKRDSMFEKRNERSVEGRGDTKGPSIEKQIRW